MKELIEKLTAKVGITEEQAKNAIDTVGEFVKSKLPAPLHKAIDGALNGESLSEGLKNQIEDLGGKINETAENLREKAEELGEDLKEKITGLFGSKK
ncbi:MAG: apolipoprotein A1/A4/E family protein [Chitinophagales bacterium]|nr:apolipoprotein A1/A4/E family protein [Chitinophagales bacterium]